MSCIVTPAGSKDIHRETGDTEKKGGPKKEQEKGEGRRGAKRRDSRGGDIDDPQRPWSPPEISTLGL